MPNTKVYFPQGGDSMEVASGGSINIASGGAIKSSDGSVLLDAKRYQSKTVADLSAEKTYYMVAKYAGKITKLSGIADGAVGTADVTATFSINGTPVTGGVVTFVSAASAAGDKTADVVPSAANTVAVGDKISFVVTGGGSGGSPSGELTVEITAQ